MFLGEISTTATANFDYEAQSSYTLEVMASDGEFGDVKNLTIYIADVNEKPFFTASTTAGEILEDETISRVVLNMAASDPDNDVLTYTILTTEPFGSPFVINSINGKVYSFNRYKMNLRMIRIFSQLVYYNDFLDTKRMYY